MTASPGAHDLLSAVWEYERALTSNDLAGLSAAFADRDDSMRADSDGLLIGYDAIESFRKARPQPPRHDVREIHVSELSADHAAVVVEVESPHGGRGRRTQVWERTVHGWKIRHAHVSPPGRGLDSRIWRVVGEPLVAGRLAGPLAGESVAVKDLFAVAGQPIGAGNPEWLASAATQTTHASAVSLLLEAGADIRGIARTDEFAFGLAGTNAHYGVPPNPRAPGRISGGSSSGPASAVSSGHATVGLGTDTGGSIRVPAAYQGLWGIRPTHGAVATDGLLPLAQSFDTVGWLCRSSDLLASVADVLLPPDTSSIEGLALAEPLLGLADHHARAAVRSVARSAGGSLRTTWSIDPEWITAFLVHTAVEAWANHGPWLTSRLDTVGPGVRERFQNGAAISPERAEWAAARVKAARAEIRELIGDQAVILPTTPSSAPLIGASLDDVRAATLQLTCIASIGGLPAVNIPSLSDEGLPLGVCLIGPAGSDRALLSLAATV